MGLEDAVWTESNWDTIQLRVYSVQDAAYDRLILLAGIAVTVLAYTAIVVTRAFITKALKQDWHIFSFSYKTTGLWGDITHEAGC